MPSVQSAQTTALLVQRDALRFAEADKDMNLELEWDEFYRMQPLKVRHEHKPAEIREWFEEADADGDGTVSVFEFFRWTLTRNLRGIEEIFRRYDTDMTGSLDELEFQRVAEDMGFGTVAHEMFMSLDDDLSGTVSYRELLSSLQKRFKANPNAFGPEQPTTYKEAIGAGSSSIALPAVSPGVSTPGSKGRSVPASPAKMSTRDSTGAAITKAAGGNANVLSAMPLMMAIAWSDSDGEARMSGGLNGIDTATWQLDGVDSKALRAQLRRGFLESGGDVVHMLVCSQRPTSMNLSAQHACSL